MRLAATPIPPRPIERFACPACGAEVTRECPTQRGIYFGPDPFELTARCARQRGTHDARGRPLPSVEAGAAVTWDELAAADEWLPVVARDGVVVVSAPPPGVVLRLVEGGDRYEVRVLAELAPSALVGPLGRLAASERVVGSVAATDVRFDAGGGAVHSPFLGRVEPYGSWRTGAPASTTQSRPRAFAM